MSQFPQSRSLARWSLLNSDGSLGEPLSVADYPSFAEGSNNNCALTLESIETAIHRVPTAPANRLDSTLVSFQPSGRLPQQSPQDLALSPPRQLRASPKRAGTVAPDGLHLYCVTRTLGQGATSVVYEAYHRVTKKWVAIKRLRRTVNLSPKTIARFLREAELLELISCDAMPAILDSGLDEAGFPFLVMDYLEGESLEQRLARGPLKDEEFLDIAAQVVDALRAIHDAGIIHRDLKPENIFLLNETGRIKLLDLGTASTVTCSREPFQARGTPHYLAPEQLTDSAVNTGSDVYSLGCVFYRLLAGVTPFVGTMTDVLHSHCLREPQALRTVRPDIAPAVESMVKNMMQKAPGLRPSVHKIGASLKLIDAGFLGHLPESQSSSAPRFSLKRTLKAAALSVSLLTMGLTAAAFALG